MNVSYRIAEASDAEELKKLNDEFNGEGSNTIENISEGLSHENVETVFVVEFNSKLIGFCCGILIKSMCYSVSYAVITELYVNKSFQRKGIGKNLMNYAEEWYRQHDVHDFQLFTGKNNTNAQRFYEYIGYRRHEDILYRKRDWWNDNLHK